MLAVFVAEKVGRIPTTPALLASFMTRVIADELIPSAMSGPVPVMDEFAVTGGGIKRTVPPMSEIGVEIKSVLVSARDDLNEHEDAPDEFVVLQAP